MRHPPSQRDTLIRYLLDELYTYEEDHSDALCPIDRQASSTHAGEGSEVQPLSAAEGREFFFAHSVETKKLLDLVGQLSQTVENQMSPPTLFPSPSQPNECLAQSFPGPLFIPSNSSSLRRGLSNYPTILNNSEDLINQPPLKRCRLENSRPNTIESPTGPSHIIPEIGRSYGARGWVQVVKDWEEADLSRSHPTPLKDWLAEWHKTTRQSSMYQQRQLIALEFIDR